MPEITVEKRQTGFEEHVPDLSSHTHPYLYRR